MQWDLSIGGGRGALGQGQGNPSSSRRTRAFAQDPERLYTFYAGTTEGLWISEDDTASWRLATASKLVVNAVLARPGGDLLLGTDGAGVLRSADRGRTWTESNHGFSERFVSHLLPDPAGRQFTGLGSKARLEGLQGFGRLRPGHLPTPGRQRFSRRRQ